MSPVEETGGASQSAPAPAPAELDSGGGDAVEAPTSEAPTSEALAEPSSGEHDDAATSTSTPTAHAVDGAGAGEGAADEAAADEAAAGGPDGEGVADEAAGPDGEEPKKKKRRRRRRKKKSAAGDVAAETQEGAGERDRERERDDHDKRPAAPFVRWFEGHPGKRHAFSVGEVVAGRVLAAEQGVIAVDLFGKALALCDAREPREIEALPEPEPVPSPPAFVPAGQAAPAIGDASGDPTAPYGEADTESAPESGADVASAPVSVLEAVVIAETIRVADEVDPLGDTGRLTPVDPSTEAMAQAESAPAAPDADDLVTEADVPAEVADGLGEDEETLAPELEDVPPPPLPNIGEIFRGRVGAVAESGHVALVNRAIDRAVAKARIESAHEEKRRVQGIVFGFNRGGFDVLVEGIRVFCPVSGMALEHIEDPHPFLGQKLEFTVAPKKAGGHGPVITRRSILERELRKARKARLKTLEPGEVVRGRVTQVREFGVFVDIGEGVEGLVHQSELGWSRNIRPADVAKPGDEIEVKVLKVGKDKQGRVGLSRRELLPNPWDEHAEAITEGAARKGKVVSTTDFGAFLELAPGIEGLLHISELGRDLKHASQAVKEGEELDVVVERADRKQRRISLSKLSPGEAQAIAEGKLDPAERPRSLKPGTHVIVVVEKVEHHGVQVQVKGVLGRRGRGYLPNRELGSASGGERKARIGPGSEIEVKIVGTDRDGGLRVSVKGREVDEERRAVRDYRKESAKQGFGTFGDLLRSKLGDAPNEDG